MTEAINMLNKLADQNTLIFLNFIAPLLVVLPSLATTQQALNIILWPYTFFFSDDGAFIAKLFLKIKKVESICRMHILEKD